MTVVLGPGWPGVLLHEAIGHGLEGDFNRKGSSAFAGRIGQRVAAKGVTVVDDGTLGGRRGSLSIDDEGTPTECTTLIEDGILKGYMQDKLNARLMGDKPTGNGRRESFAQLPMPRMTNTYMLAGQHDPDEIIRSVKKGIYAPNFGGGQVDITSGKFVFSASEAYLIEDGKITAPVKGATLIGSGPEVLNRVSMIGNDLELDEGVGVCGKDGQSVPVGVGQPTLRIDCDDGRRHRVLTQPAGCRRIARLAWAFVLAWVVPHVGRTRLGRLLNAAGRTRSQALCAAVSNGSGRDLARRRCMPTVRARSPRWCLDQRRQRPCGARALTSASQALPLRRRADGVPGLTAQRHAPARVPGCIVMLRPAVATCHDCASRSCPGATCCSETARALAA